MLWWLAVKPRYELSRGVLRLQPWLGAAEATRIAEALAALLPGPLPVMALPYSRLIAADPAALKRLAAILLVELPQDVRLPPGQTFQSLIVAWGPGGDPSPTRPLRELLLMVLQLSLAQDTHPLGLLGAGPWLSSQLARRAAEPEELLDLLDRAVAHRRGLPDQDERGWARSVEHAAGAHVAARLLRLPAEERWALLRVLIGLGKPVPGLLAGERAGLLSLNAGEPVLTAVARGLNDGEARGGLLAGLEGEALPEDLRAALMPAVVESSVSNQSLPTPSSVGDSLVADAARAWIDGLSGPRDVELLARGLDALALANQAAHYSDEARLRALGPTVIALRSAARSAGGGAQAAAALAELIVLTAAWLPEDEEAQAGAVEALRRLRGQGVVPEAVWAAALVRWAERLLSAPKAMDQRPEAEAALRELATLDLDPRLGAERRFLVGRLADQRGELDEAMRDYLAAIEGFAVVGDERGRAAALDEIADIHRAQGQLDLALRIWREEVVPIYERLGDVRDKAITLSRIADVYQARGQLDEALRIRREVELPTFESLGDVRNKAVAIGKIADVLEARGQPDEALRLRREEVLPVYERLGDADDKATIMGKIADVFQARGQLDEALRIQQEEVLPVYERLGDVRGKALTMSRIADMLQAGGQLDEALRIRRQEELPVYERLGDVRNKAVTMSKIAAVVELKGQFDEALRIEREEVLPVFERLALQRDVLVTQANIAINLLRRQKPKHRDEARTLLTTALESAIKLNLPTDAAHIRSIFRKYHLRPPT